MSSAIATQTPKISATGNSTGRDRIRCRPFLESLLPSNLRIHVEERLDRLPERPLDLFFASFNQMHGHPRRLSVLENHGGILHFAEVLFRQQPHSVDQRQLGHSALPFSNSACRALLRLSNSQPLTRVPRHWTQTSGDPTIRNTKAVCKRRMQTQRPPLDARISLVPARLSSALEI